MKCRKCGSENSVKNGQHLGRQRYKCKACGFQFTQEKSSGKDIEIKCLAIILYLNGLSLRVIGRILKVSHKAVFDWVKDFGLDTIEKPEPVHPVVVKINDMWNIIFTKKTNYRNGKYNLALQINSSTGKVDSVIVTP